MVAAISLAAYLGTECAFSSTCLETRSMRNLSAEIFNPVFLYSLWILPISGLVLLIPEKIYKNWHVFTLWWLLASLVLLFFVDTRAGGWLNIIPLTRIEVTWVLASFYAFISVILIAVDTLNAKQRKH